MGNVVTPKFRISYPHLFRAKKNELSGKDEFSCVALFDKDADLSELKKAAAAACEKKWGSDKAKWPKKLNLPFRDQGDKESDDGTLPDGMTKGAIYMNLKAKNAPGLVNQKREEILDETEIYAGCYCRAQVNAYAYSQAGNNGVAFGLNHVQKLAEGKPLGGGRTKARDAFTDVEMVDADKDDDIFT